jgi:hypothetical protein
MKGTLRRQSLCLGTVGACGASYILRDAQVLFKISPLLSAFFGVPNLSRNR